MYKNETNVGAVRILLNGQAELTVAIPGRLTSSVAAASCMKFQNAVTPEAQTRVQY
jgi:hypothetical protein